jgi:hypothetical protein
MYVPGTNPEQYSMSNIDDLDRPVQGAKQIARVLDLKDEDGNLDVRRTFYVLEKGYVDADKWGRIWTSTPRRLLKLPRGGQVA